MTQAHDNPDDRRKPLSLDARLGSLFGGLDTAPGFEAIVLARVAAESDAVQKSSAADRFQRAQLEEARRYRAARRSIGWSSHFRRWVTLDTLGFAALGAIAVRMLWMHLQMPAEITDFARQNAAQLLMSLGLVLASVPILAQARRLRT